MWWLVGFTDGDGVFNSVINKTNKAVLFRLRYQIHKDDRICLENIIKILNINLTIYSNKNKDLIVLEIIIYFKNYHYSYLAFNFIENIPPSINQSYIYIIN